MPTGLPRDRNGTARAARRPAGAMMALHRLKLLKFLLGGVIVGFALAAFYISTLVLERQDALKQVWRYNTAWLASQAVVEFMRFEQRVSAFGLKGSRVDQDEVQLRFDILLNRLQLLSEGEFEEFVRQDPERQQTLRHLGTTLSAVQPLVESLDRPGAVQAVLDRLAPLDAELVALASAANRAGGDRVAEDQSELIRLHWFFTSLASSLILFGIALVGLLMWRNRLLERARNDSQTLASNLRRTSGDLETANRHFDAALSNMAQGLAMFDHDQRLTVRNERYLQVMGHDPEVAKPGVFLRDIVEYAVAAGRHPGETVDDIMATRAALFARGEPARLHVALGDGRIVETSYRPMPDGGWVVTYDDITERRRTEAQIAYMAHHDALTGLANRVLFRETIEQALARVRRYGDGFAVICLDLDHFKDVNDTLGHPVGDALLRAVADRVRGCVRESDVVARLGGDEFAILQIGGGQGADASALASRLVESLSAAFDLDGHEIVVGASLGVAMAPTDGTDPDQLIKNADMALYRAKADGRGSYRFFEPDMDACLQERRALEVDLRAALANGEFELFYQPLVDVATNRITCFEALMRWRHPGRGMVSPAEFIPVAEEIGLIGSLGEWALQEACREAARWPAPVRVAVNLSRRRRSGTESSCGRLWGPWPHRASRRAASNWRSPNRS
jgi:diguanylate cyclase (GGDEF)-like protein